MFCNSQHFFFPILFRREFFFSLVKRDLKIFPLLRVFLLFLKCKTLREKKRKFENFRFLRWTFSQTTRLCSNKKKAKIVFLLYLELRKWKKGLLKGRSIFGFSISFRSCFSMRICMLSDLFFSNILSNFSDSKNVKNGITQQLK